MFFHEPPKLNQSIAIEYDIRVQNTNVLAGGGGDSSIDGAAIAEIFSGLQIVDAGTGLEKFARAVERIVVNDSEGEWKRHVEAAKKKGKLLDTLQSVVVGRYKGYIRGRNRGFPRSVPDG